MNKVAVVYWSGTGHTQAMAEAVAEAAGATLFTAADFDGSKMGDFDAVAFGCPSMGTEQLEESEFEPMFETCRASLNGKKIALFGSYGWGDGEWMRTWESDCQDAGAVLACDSVICQDEPDDDVLAACRALGEALK
ncbi:MAG: flavodoxin domain-containing protein [Clostridia bacterium]|nr:flavodoxin domain-containing protein [Clostridia bacterium]